MNELNMFDLVPVMFVVVGGTFAFYGVRAFASGLSFRRRAVRCPAVVTGFRSEWSKGGSNSSGRYIHYPILAFRTAAGADVRTVSSYGSSTTRLREGQQVRVLYDPEDPKVAYPGRAVSSWLLPLVSVLFGALFLAVGVAVLIGSGTPAKVLDLLGGG